MTIVTIGRTVTTVITVATVTLLPTVTTEGRRENFFKHVVAV